MHITFIEALYYLFYAIELPNLFLLKQSANVLLVRTKRGTDNVGKSPNGLEGLFSLTRLVRREKVTV